MLFSHRELSLFRPVWFAQRDLILTAPTCFSGPAKITYAHGLRGTLLYAYYGFMSENTATKKDGLRAEAKRARSLMSLNADQQERLCDNFFHNITVSDGDIIAAYWPKGRELDTSIIIEKCFEKNLDIALPIVEKGTRVLKFALLNHKFELEEGEYSIMQPVQNETTQYVQPNIFIVPLLAFDRSGYRLGYGGGYYDATLSHYSENGKIISIGLAYAQQACLFNLPRDEHDMKLDWVITEQSALKF